MSSTVRDVMTAKVVALRKNADYKEIVSVLHRHRVSACPVVDDTGRVVGMVSEADLLYKETDPDLPAGLIRLEWRLAEESKATAVTAAQLMTTPPVTIHPGAAVTDAARLMQEHRIKRLPVVGQDGHLVGIVSRTDVLGVYERPDADIKDEVTKVVIGTEFALDQDAFNVEVGSGIVTVTGVMDRRESALSLLARIRHTEGVVSVRDRITYQPET